MSARDGTLMWRRRLLRLRVRILGGIMGLAMVIVPCCQTGEPVPLYGVDPGPVLYGMPVAMQSADTPEPPTKA